MLFSTSIQHYCIIIVSNHRSERVAFFPHLCRFYHTYSFEIMLSKSEDHLFFSHLSTDLARTSLSKKNKSIISPHIHIICSHMRYQSIHLLIVHLLSLQSASHFVYMLRKSTFCPLRCRQHFSWHYYTTRAFWYIISYSILTRLPPGTQIIEKYTVHVEIWSFVVVTPLKTSLRKNRDRRIAIFSKTRVRSIFSKTRGRFRSQHLLCHFLRFSYQTMQLDELHWYTHHKHHSTHKLWSKSDNNSFFCSFHAFSP